MTAVAYAILAAAWALCPGLALPVRAAALAAFTAGVLLLTLR